jgi:hypothetical protein
MGISRRLFTQWAASVSAVAMGRRAGHAVSQLDVGSAGVLRSHLLPSKDEVWAHQVWMAKLGPKYTGNKAHGEYVDFLATNLKLAGLEVQREHYTLSRWEVRRRAIEVRSATGQAVPAPVTSYFPYSGHTPVGGITGEIVYAGGPGRFQLDGLEGKIALVDCPTLERPWGQWYQLWSSHPSGERFPTSVKPARSSVTDLEQFRKAGAAAVILGWTDISDANAADQYSPFSLPLQNIAGLYVGRDTHAKLRTLAGTGAKATVVLEGEMIPSTTDSLIATLAGSTSDENIIVNTHTDGTSAIQENGPIAILALAKYFSRIARADRKRTLVFPLTTGHLAAPWVPPMATWDGQNESIRGIIQKYPELIKKTVASLAIEHLGCMEWRDDESMRYKPTGQNEWSVAITASKSTADIMAAAAKDSRDRIGIVKQVSDRWIGEGAPLGKMGIPTVGYIPMPNYLLAAPADGGLDKVNPELLYSQIQMFGRAIHALDGMSAAQLKGA